MRLFGRIVGLGMLAMVGCVSALPAQQAQAKSDQLTKRADELMAQVIRQAQACPVGFQAEVDPRLVKREVKDGKKVVESTSVRLSFMPTDAKKTMVAASVTAHGIAPSGQLMLVSGSLEESRTQAFQLKWASGAAGLLEREVTVTDVPFVRWVELNQVTYGDGTVWSAAEGASCRAELSKFHYVSAR